MATSIRSPRWCSARPSALRARGWRLATAESCTGGLIAAACTDLAGSSDWFERGFVTYSNEAKTELLGVPAALIAAHGAVSEAVARRDGRRRAARAQRRELAVAVTGIAGPGGGTPASRWARSGSACGAARDGAVQAAARCSFDGDRAAVRGHGASMRCAACCDAACAHERAAGRRVSTPPSATPGGTRWAQAMPRAPPGARAGELFDRTRDRGRRSSPTRRPAACAVCRALRLIQSLWAGVDRLLDDPTCRADVPLARMVDPAMTAAMAETALWAVLSLHRGFFVYAAPAAQRRVAPACRSAAPTRCR